MSVNLQTLNAKLIGKLSKEIVEGRRHTGQIKRVCSETKDWQHSAQIE